MESLRDELKTLQEWMIEPRFAGITRVHTARQVIEQRGRMPANYIVAREAAEGFYARLRELFASGESITTFGPYSPGQAVAMKRAGIEGIYLGGWATSAKGSKDEDPGPDLASYPLSQVPDEGAGLVRALLTADRNQRFTRLRMTEAEQEATPEIDFRPYIIADADTGHGGDAHVRNLIRRFVEVGVPGYHIEDQKPGAKKCGHQGGKVLVPEDEQVKRLSAARFQLDIMGVPGIIVARTDAEAANLLDGCGDERDQPFILGVTNRSVPSYKAGFLAMMRRLNRAGVEDVNGYLLYALSEAEYEQADVWLVGSGLAAEIDQAGERYASGGEVSPELVLDAVADRFIERWQAAAGLKTYAAAVADAMAFRADEDAPLEMSEEEWQSFAATRILVHRSGEGGGPGFGCGVGRGTGEDSRGLLPNPGWCAICHREIPCCGAVRGPAMDGNEDGGSRGRPGVRGSHPCGVPGQDVGVQPFSVVQLGYHRHERG